MTVTAAPECSALPSDARSRSYMVTVTQDPGPSFHVELEGEFLRVGNGTLNRFDGFFDGNRLSMNISSSLNNYFYLPDLVEVIAPSSYHSFDGRVNAAVGTTISANLSGSIVRFAGPPYRPVLRCTSESHQFVMVKQQ